MVGEVAGKKLYDAAAKGDATTFEELVQENPDLLDGVSFACWNRRPLHVATMQGNAEIVEIMLRRNPQLAEELDSQKSSPLHIAAAKGYVRIASRLLTAAKHMCWSRDCHGMNPIHIAAMNGHLEILKKLIEADPFPAREKLGRGETVMHLCVKHRQVPALQFLADKLGDLVEEGDENGNTVLHLAARYKQPGGVWQEDSSLHKTGEAVMASNHSQIYKHFVRANTVAFTSSMIAIILLTTNLPAENVYATMLTLCATWVSVASIAVSYGASVMVITPYTQTPSFNLVIYIVIVVCVVPYGMVAVCGAFIALVPKMNGYILEYLEAIRRAGGVHEYVMRELRRRQRRLHGEAT